MKKWFGTMLAAVAVMSSSACGSDATRGDGAAPDGSTGCVGQFACICGEAQCVAGEWVCGPCPDSGTPLPSGLVGWWRFDEGSGDTANDAVGTNHGVLINGAAWSAGKVGQAVALDGVDDYVNIPDSTVFDFGTGDFSLSAWFKTSSPKDHHVLNFRQDDNDPHIELYAAPTPFGYLGTHLLPDDTRISHDGTRVDDGVWHHAAVVLKNGVTDGYKLYLDGALVGQTTYSGVLENWDSIRIGDRADGDRAFDGAIDEVMVFAKALSDEEVQQVYQYTLASTP